MSYTSKLEQITVMIWHMSAAQQAELSYRMAGMPNDRWIEATAAIKLRAAATQRRQELASLLSILPQPETIYGQWRAEPVVSAFRAIAMRDDLELQAEEYHDYYYMAVFPLALTLDYYPTLGKKSWV
jgi:hypothetical protein